MTTYDAIVVGARCAGAATAMLLARRGMRVLAIDRGQYGSDTLSTHALMRGGVLQLARWGVLRAIVAAGTPAVRSVSFYYDGERVQVPIKARDGVEALFAPRRSVLDRLLVDAARHAGAEIAYHTRLGGLMRAPDGRVRGAVLEGPNGGGRRVPARIVIGADGLRSTMVQLVGAVPYYVGRHSSAVVYGYWPDMDVREYEWHFIAGASAGVIPTNDGQTCVFASTPAAQFHDVFGGHVAAGYLRTLERVAPAIAAAVGRASRTVSLHGFPGHAAFLRQSVGPGWALVGDAGYFKDPLTAHGITDALRDAELLADAIAEGTDAALARYQQQRDELSRGVFDVTDAIAAYDWTIPEVRVLHELLAREMSREVTAMTRWGPTVTAA
ncbi:MAG TPA: NAD(P)/FAD-dependent oxidoreductase [Vicinamibacterales bacterium]|nr:NAD(P)/FAD-dependent oxidoreductase [Vicinamibacterales bacterium]